MNYRWIIISLALLNFVHCAKGNVSELDLPINRSDLANTKFWPYGVHGGSHPEGHKGWDFKSSFAMNIMAPADAVVTDLSKNEKAGYDLKLSYSSMLSGSIQHIEPSADVKVGSKFKRGERLGVATETNPGLFVIHFDISVGTEKVCPYQFMSELARNALGQKNTDPGTIMSEANYAEMGTEPSVCNPI